MNPWELHDRGIQVSRPRVGCSGGPVHVLPDGYASPPEPAAPPREGVGAGR